jgi:hypothetical protein
MRRRQGAGRSSGIAIGPGRFASTFVFTTAILRSTSSSRQARAECLALRHGTDDVAQFHFQIPQLGLPELLIRRQQRLPGMPVEAFIRTEERSPISYFVKPLADYFNRAFRET